VEAAVGYELVQLPGAMVAPAKGFIGNFLQDFLDPAAFSTFILVEWHLTASS
jgi:hypothetical protein